MCARLQEYIEAETFLGSSGQDNTETLLADVSPHAREAEAFASERAQLQVRTYTIRCQFPASSLRRLCGRLACAVALQHQPFIHLCLC